MAERSKARVRGRSLAGVAGSNHAGGMDVCVLCVLYSKGQKGKSRDNPDKETSTDTVQSEKNRMKKNPGPSIDVCFACCKQRQSAERSRQ